MLTDRLKTSALCLFCAVALAAQLFALASLPFELAEPWDKLFHCLAYASLTLLAWIALDGRRPLAVTMGVMALAFADELCQGFVAARGADLTDFLAGALAAGMTGVLLYRNTGEKKSCVESSPQ